jgi:hypothetical protein
VQCCFELEVQNNLEVEKSSAINLWASRNCFRSGSGSNGRAFDSLWGALIYQPEPQGHHHTDERFLCLTKCQGKASFLLLLRWLPRLLLDLGPLLYVRGAILKVRSVHSVSALLSFSATSAETIALYFAVDKQRPLRSILQLTHHPFLGGLV